MLHSLRNWVRTIGFVALVVPALTSCDSEAQDEAIPTAPAMETSFHLADSMQVAEAYRASYPSLYEQVHQKTYHISSQNQSEVYFYEDQEGVTLFVRETSKGKDQPWLSFTFKGRTAESLPSRVSLTDASVVCVKEGQQFADGSMAMSPECAAVLGGEMELAYNKGTNVLSGKISHLEYGIGYYVPSYAFPNHTGLYLQASGSSRTVDVTFNYVRERHL